jgi:hypothetical protein
MTTLIGTSEFEAGDLSFADLAQQIFRSLVDFADLP